jgi:hypothetical protein
LVSNNSPSRPTPRRAGDRRVVSLVMSSLFKPLSDPAAGPRARRGGRGVDGHDQRCRRCARVARDVGLLGIKVCAPCVR